jgi:hypothetical protein
VECEGTVHHLIALFCTVAGNSFHATLSLRGIFNEINDLGLVPNPVWGQKTVLDEALSEATESDSSRIG